MLTIYDHMVQKQITGLVLLLLNMEKFKELNALEF